MPTQRVGHFAILVVALLLLGQGRLTAPSGSVVWQTIALQALGVTLFLWLAKVAANPLGPVSEKRNSIRLVSAASEVLSQHPGRVALMLASIASQENALRLNAGRPANSPDQWIAFLCWLLSIALFLAACWPSHDLHLRSIPWKAWVQSRRVDLAIMAALMVIGFALRAVARETIPYPLTGDEASVGMSGLAIVRGAVTNMFGTGWSSQPNLSFLLPGLFERFFGADIGGLRLFPALVGTLAIPLLYLLALEQWGRRVAILSAAYLTAYHYHIHFSRIAVNNVADPTLWLLAFYLLWRGVRTRLAIDWAAAGIVAGLGIYSYAGGRLAMVLVAIVVAFILLRQPRRLRERLRNDAVNLLAMLGGTLTAVLPMAIYFSHHLNQFGARANQVGLWQTGWLQSTLRQPGQSLLGILADRIWRTFFTFTTVPATLGFYNSPEPLLGPVAGTLFLIGFAWSLWHWRNPAYFMIDIWFISVEGGAALTVDLPNAARTTSAAPMAALLVAIGLAQLIDTARSFVQVSPRTSTILTAVAMVALCLGSLRFYFLEYIPGNYFADANSELGMEAGYYLRSLGPQYRAYFFGQPRMFFNFPSIEYLRGDVTGMDGPAALPADLSFVARDRGAAFIFIPERAGEAERIQQEFPGGKMLTFRRKTKDEVLFVAYEIPPR